MRGDNAMYGQVEVYDQSLEQVLVYEPGRMAASSRTAAWADDVAPARRHRRPGRPGRSGHLLRVPIDGGEPETLVGPVDGPNPERASAFVLSD